MSSPPIFIVTGFGKFFHLENNPTEALVNFLRYLPPGPMANIASSTTLKVAAQDVSDWFTSPLSGIPILPGQGANKPIVFLHFGLSEMTNKFCLESTAYNMADFRGPDERGLLASRAHIDKALLLDQAEVSTLPLEDICRDLQNQGFPVRVSNDPGRFVCNYTYWHSLRFCKTHPGCYSLFIHVPPFQKISEKDQRRFVVAATLTIGAVVANLRKPEASPMVQRRFCLWITVAGGILCTTVSVGTWILRHKQGK